MSGQPKEMAIQPKFDARAKQLVSRMGQKALGRDVLGQRSKYVPYLAEHLDYTITLEADGKIFASGPMNVPGLGDGMTILRVDTEEEARVIANADPLVTKLGRTFSLHPWTVNEGQITLTVSILQMVLGLD